MIAMSPILNAYFQADLFGKFIFFSLFILSITSWVILLHKLYLAKKLKLLNSRFEKKVQTNNENILSININSNSTYPYLNIYKSLKDKTLEILNKNRFFINEKKNVYMSSKDIELIDSHLDVEILKQTKLLEKNLFILPTVVTLGPFLGLLGTVWGILITFNTLQTQSLLNNNTSILSGLSMALSTTVVGLMVAIPALIAYNYLKNWIKNFRNDMLHFSHGLITTLEIQYRNVDVK
ncbi:MAG: Biopolymer transport protein ExbB [Candidatus Anoxychlamydiales bacterium]|nr:Biopolymer transport protein ExbB [Candidatus Anoxychlamydiales bacterium]